MPAVFLEVLAEKYGDDALMVATHFDNCLRAYPMEEWEKIEAKANSLPATNNDVKIYRRHFISSAEFCACDKQGRILLPPTHREWANIAGGQVLLLGQTNMIEIWDRAAYEARMNAVDFSAAEQAIDALGGLM